MKIRDLLMLDACAQARRVAADGPAVGDPDAGGPDTADLFWTSSMAQRRVRLAHVVDVPDAQRWVRPGTVLLTTGLSWPHEPDALRRLGEDLAQCDPAAVVLAVPHFFETFPPEVATALAARGIPALELPYDVPFVQVVQETHEFILRAQADVLERSEAIHRALTRAALSGQLSEVAGTLARELGRAAALLGRDGQPLTVGQAGEQAVPAPALARQALARPGNGPRPLAGGTLVPLLLRGQREGGVWVAGQDGQNGELAVPDLHVRAAEHAATVAALLLLAQRDLEVREARLGYAFVDTLLEGRFTTDPTSQERATRLGFDPDGLYTVALLVLNEPLPLSPEGFTRRERAAAQVREVLGSLGVAPLVSIGLNQVWFLVPQGLPPERVWGRLSDPAHGGNRQGLIYGRARLGADGVAQGRQELLALAAYARMGQMRSYAEVLLPRALSGDREAQLDLVGSLLIPLRQARGGDALVQTVQALCDSGFAQTQTAARLGIHGNTLRYRMSRIEALTGRLLDDPDTRSLWWLALQLDRLH